MTTPAIAHVVGAQARGLQRVRVAFDVAVTQGDGAAADDALAPMNYAFTRRSAPAVDGVAVASVELVTATAVELVTDLPLTPGALYDVTVLGVAAAPTNTAAFTGFVPPRPPNRAFELWRMLPELNRREDDTGDLAGFLGCLQEVTDLLLADIDGFTEILDPDLAAESVLDRMLGELGDPFAFDLTAVDKRRLIHVLVAIYREKGTAAGIVNAIRFFLNLEVTITSYAGEALSLGDSLLGVDWVLGPSEPWGAYAFEVTSPRILTADERARLDRIVDYMKPAHTHVARLVEPVPPVAIDHVELGLSDLDDNWALHGGAVG